MSIKFLLLGGGGVFWVLGGGSADFIFMGAGIFLILKRDFSVHGFWPKNIASRRDVMVASC